MANASDRQNSGIEERKAPPTLQRDVPLAPFTTLNLGGPARYFLPVTSEEQLESARRWADGERIPWMILGEGSNILFSDEGYPGLVIQNRITGIERDGLEVEVGGAENLPRLIEWLNSRGLAGMERMYGIPGTVAGALVGNAGAYGQEIGDSVVDVQACSAKGRLQLQSEDLGLRYRHSLLKVRRDLVLLRCRLRLRKTSGNLQRISDSILEKRLVKYPVGLRCPGSFFKNVVFEELSQTVRDSIPEDWVMHGKIPAGRLLQEVGARGACRGGAWVADYHGNLIVNRGAASSSDIRLLAEEYGTRVEERFGIRLEAEILIVDSRGRLK